MAAFSVPIASIFAREVLEACVIVGQYRSVVKAQDWEEQRIASALRIIWLAAGAAAAVALVLVLALGIGLGVAGSELDNKPAEIIEGVSKVVAAFCIALLSLKIPKWMGLRQSSSKKVDVTNGELWFNVAWNIWREIAEIGVFLIPAFLDGDELAGIPLSGLLGTLIGLLLGGGIYLLNKRLEKTRWALALFMVVLTGLLATGLFTGGCHEFEEVWGETEDVYELPKDAFSHKKFPFVLLKPFGYSQSPSVLQMCCFWLFGGSLAIIHVVLMMRQRERTSREHKEADKADAKEEQEQVQV
jgi:high-affinity iron transporter